MNIFQASKGQNEVNFDNFRTPFYDEIKDPQQLSYVFNRYPIVPFMGTNEDSSDSILQMIYRLGEVTPIFQGIISSMKMFISGAGLDVIRQEGNQIFNRSNVEISDTERSTLDTKLSEILTGENLETIINKSTVSMLVDGNIGLLVRVSKLGKVELKHIDTRTFRYHKDTVNTTEKTVLIAPTFAHDYMINVEPYLVPCYPTFHDNDGVMETFIHVKDEQTGRKIYGLSSAASSLMQQYLINQIMVYLSAETDNRFTGQVLFDVPVLLGEKSEVPNEGKALLDSLRKVFKAKGNGESVAVHFRNEDAPELKVTEFKSNTNEKFYQTVREIVTEEIVTAFGWDKRLVGISKQNGLGGDDLETIFAISSQKVLTHQKHIETALNTALLAMSDTGFNFADGYKFKLKNLYKSMILENEFGLKNL
jgi:hypothetical protein